MRIFVQFRNFCIEFFSRICHLPQIFECRRHWELRSLRDRIFLWSRLNDRGWRQVELHRWVRTRKPSDSPNCCSILRDLRIWRDSCCMRCKARMPCKDLLRPDHILSPRSRSSFRFVRPSLRRSWTSGSLWLPLRQEDPGSGKCPGGSRLRKSFLWCRVQLCRRGELGVWRPEIILICWFSIHDYVFINFYFSIFCCCDYLIFRIVVFLLYWFFDFSVCRFWFVEFLISWFLDVSIFWFFGFT